MNYYSIKISIFTFAEVLFGKKRIRRLFLKKVVSEYKKGGLIFIHIPRTGGTSISNAIFGKRNGHFSALELRNYLGMDFFHAVFSFAVVRNPFERLVSAYLFIKNGGSKHGAVRPNKVFNSKAFECFEDFVKTWLIFQPPHSIDILLRPQYLFVTDENDHLIINKIYHLENLDSLKEEIGLIINRSFSIPRLNNTNCHIFSKYYSEELVDLVFDYYKKDFIIFNYTKEFPINSFVR